MRTRSVLALATTLACAAGLLIGVPAVASADPCDGASAAPFADRDQISAAHRDAVDCLWHLGIVRGHVDADGRTRFSPRADVTRAQFAGLLHRTLDTTGTDEAFGEPRRPRFDDVPAGHTFDDEVHVLAAAGVIHGLDTRRFAPASPIRRDQTASLLVRAAAWASDRELTASAGPHFGDTTTSVHAEAIDAAFEYGLVEGIRRPCGDGGGVYAPGRHTERQQVATVLVRALSALEEIRAGGGGDRRGEATCPVPTWEPDITAARDYARQRTGSVSFAAIGTDGRLVGYRSDTTVAAASTLKVMFLVAYLRQPDVRDRPLTASDRELLEPMIRRSENEPATRIADRLGPGPMERLAERAGMRDFSYTRPWGNSRTSARDQARFLRDLPQHLPARHRAYALQLLTEVVPSQRWGIGEVATPGWTQHFKGGWGSGTGSVDHQVVLLRRDGTDVSLAVMTTGNHDHEDGKATLRGVFQRLLADLP
jgi:hypothetical protein